MLYGYSSNPLYSLFGGSTLSSSAASSAAIGMLFVGVIASLAFLALVIVGVIFFIRKKSPKRYTTLGRFFNFDRYWIQTILRFLFMVFTMATVVTVVAVPLEMAIVAGAASPLYGCVTFIGMLLLSVIGGAVFLLFMRLGFEWIIAFINQCEDVRALRHKFAPEGEALAAEDRRRKAQAKAKGPVVDGNGRPIPGANPNMAAPAGAAAAPNMQQAPAGAAPAPTMQQAPAAGSWQCPECGKLMDNGNFCTGCGHRR